MKAGVDETTAQTLIEAGSVRGARVTAQGRSWSVELQTGSGQWVPLVAARGHVRTWKSLDTLVRWLRDLGVAQFSLDARAHDPDQRDMAV